VVVPDRTLEPSGTAVISVNDALRDAGVAPWAELTGYVEVQYTWPWDPLCVTVTSVDTAHSVIFTSSLRPLYPPRLLGSRSAGPASRVHVLEGMWWRQEPQVTGFVTLSNITEQPVAAAVQVTDGQGRLLGQHRVTVSSHGTKLLGLKELNQARDAAGGIRVSYVDDHEALSVNGGLQDLASGYSANIQFIPTAAPSEGTEEMKIVTYAEIGLMTGAPDPMMLFPADIVFKPYSVIRNVSDQAVDVSPTVFWMQAGAARSALLGRFVLPPHRTQSLDVRSLLSGAGLSEHNGSINLILDVQGQPGSVIMASGSVDQKNNYVFEVAPRGVKESASKNLGYWSTANGDDTMVTLWNPADEAQDFVFTFFFSGGHYAWPVHLDARATRMFNVSEVIQNQIPDKDGNLIPSTIHDGSAKVSGTRGENEHILVVMDAGTYNVRKATCNGQCIWCNGAADAWLTIPLIPDTETAQVTMTDQWNTGTQYNLTDDSWWTSYETTIATINSTSGLAKGISAGSATFEAQDGGEFVYAQSCVIPPCPVQAGVQASGNGTVQKPTYFGPTGYAVANCECAANTAGTCINVSDQVLDQNGTAMKVSGLTPKELVCNPGGCDKAYKVFSTPETTTATGTFNDTPIGSCFGPPKPTTNVCTGITVSYQAVLNGTTYSVTTLTDRTDCVQGEKDQIYSNPAAYNKTYTTGTVP
jgi:hypothetical protein